MSDLLVSCGEYLLSQSGEPLWPLITVPISDPIVTPSSHQGYIFEHSVIYGE